MDGTDENYLENYQTIRDELFKYDPLLAEKKEILCLNKCDALMPQEVTKRMKKLKKASGKEVFSISGVTKEGVEVVLRKLLESIKVQDIQDSEEEVEAA